MSIDFELDLESLYETPIDLPDVASGASFRAWHLRKLDGSAFAAFGGSDRLSARQLAYFAGWALLAPTTHNTVPERFTLHENEGAIGFWIDRDAVLPESDPVGRQASVSL